MAKFKLPDDGSGISWEMEDVIGEPGKWIIKTEQDTDPCFEFNRDIRNHGYTGDISFGRHVARIPHVTWNDWVKRYPCLRNGKRDPGYQKMLFRLIMSDPRVKPTNDKLGTLSDNTRKIYIGAKK